MARGKNFQKLMLSEKKKRSDLGLHIFLPKSRRSLKKKKKGLHSESSSEQTSAANPKLYVLFSRGAPKKGGLEATASFASPNIHYCVTASPKPIERQSVSICLRIFCDKTIAALESQPKINYEAASGTVNFLKIVLKLWKIFNVKNPRENQAHNDAMRAVIKMPDDPRIKFLLNVAAMADGMRPTTNPRVCLITSDSAKFLAHICRGAVDLTRHLLESGNEYVMLGWFSTDPLERAFGKLLQDSRLTYFLNAQSVIEKIRIQRAKLSTQLKLNISNDSAGDEHECELCKRLLTDEECEIFDNLQALEKSVGSDVVAAILYIAGYLQKQANQNRDNDTMYYYDKFGKYLDQLNRGVLVLPQGHLVQWCIYCFVLFTQIGERVCRTFLINLLISIFNISLKMAF